MRPIPLKLRSQISKDPFYAVCARKGIGDHQCEGRITLEHAVIYAGRQVNEKWAIIPLCEKAHSVNNFQDGGELDKDLNLWVALNRASDEVLRSFSKATNYLVLRERLNAIYGLWQHKAYLSLVAGLSDSKINY